MTVRDVVFGVILSTFNKELYEKDLKQNAYEAGMKACRLLNIAYEEYEQAK